MGGKLTEPLGEFKPRELEILGMMAEGLSNQAIAEQLFITKATVRWYNKQIYSKLGTSRRTEAIAIARSMGLLQSQASTGDIEQTRNLPEYATPFVGRDHEIEEITTVLGDPEIRLITLAGVGGIGKTRLGIEVAHRVIDDFFDGVFYVSLGTLQTDHDIIVAIANAIGVRVISVEQLLDYIGNRNMLFVLDNFEHLLDAVHVVNNILTRCPNVNILVTSRTSLNLSKEWIRQLDGIGVPSAGDIENLEAFGAVELFMRRAQLVQGGFSLKANRDCVIQLCQMLHGMPLAIELAATWLKTLSCHEIIEEVEHNLDFLSTQHADIKERHRSLSAVFEQSWKMLSAREKSIIKKLAAFRGGFGRKAAQQVTRATLQELNELINKSILQHDGMGLIFMHELMRQYAEQHLVRDFQHAKGTMTNLMVAWRLLLMGHFDHAELAADNIIDANEQKKPEEEAIAFALLGIIAGVREDYEQCNQLSKAAFNLIQHETDARNVVALYFAYLGLAISSCGVEDYNTATEAITTAIQLATEIQIPAFIYQCLPVTAIIMAYHAEVERAIEMIALTHSGIASTPAWLKSWELFTNLEHTLLTEVGTSTHNKIWERGQSLQLDSIIHGFYNVLAQK